MPEILNPTANRVATEQLPGTASREEVCRRVRETGVIPVLRGASPEAALFVAESLAQAESRSSRLPRIGPGRWR